MSEQKACCAHIVVRYMPRLNPSGSVTSEWKCSACGVPFVPAAEYDALRAVLDIEAKAREGREELLQENERLRRANDEREDTPSEIAATTHRAIRSTRHRPILRTENRTLCTNSAATSSAASPNTKSSAPRTCATSLWRRGRGTIMIEMAVRET